MQRDFDPYAEWLKIPPGRRPPSYYDLLGVPDDETDQQRVEEAASERVEGVRARALGEQGQRVTPILNELARALDCLLDPERRQAYDEKHLGEVVRRWLESAGDAAARGVGRRRGRTGRRARFPKVPSADPRPTAKRLHRKARAGSGPLGRG